MITINGIPLSQLDSLDFTGTAIISWNSDSPVACTTVIQLKMLLDQCGVDSILCRVPNHPLCNYDD